MTVALLVSRPGTMPGFNSTVELDEVQPLSRYCFFSSLTLLDCLLVPVMLSARLYFLRLVIMLSAAGITMELFIGPDNRTRTCTTAGFREKQDLSQPDKVDQSFSTYGPSSNCGK